MLVRGLSIILIYVILAFTYSQRASITHDSMWPVFPFTAVLFLSVLIITYEEM